MKILLFVFVSSFLTACGDSGDSQTARAAGNSGGEVDYCTCVNEPITSDVKHKACSQLMNSMTPEETAAKAMACRESLAVPQGGPDLCFCLRTTSSDADLMRQCDDMIPDDWTAEELTRKLVECAQ